MKTVLQNVGFVVLEEGNGNGNAEYVRGHVVQGKQFYQRFCE